MGGFGVNYIVIDRATADKLCAMEYKSPIKFVLEISPLITHSADRISKIEKALLYLSY